MGERVEGDYPMTIEDILKSIEERGFEGMIQEGGEQMLDLANLFAAAATPYGPATILLAHIMGIGVSLAAMENSGTAPFEQDGHGLVTTEDRIKMVNIMLQQVIEHARTQVAEARKQFGIKRHVH